LLADSESTIVVNGDKHLAGRLCSVVAKMLLNGNRIALVNTEKILMSGSRANILKENELRLEITSRVHPKHGPFHPRRPDTYIEKMVRGMLPYKKSKGNAAKKRLRVYISVPEKYQKAEHKTIETALAPRSLSYYTTIGELCSSMGWRKLE
jgi:large subunit ribosomal protein L13